jgi:hypothetical protein
MLAELNTLNVRSRWLKFTLMEDVVIISMQLKLGACNSPQELFAGAFAAFMEGVQASWEDVVRVASRRGKRSRLEREIEGLLAQQGVQGSDS